MTKATGSECLRGKVAVVTGAARGIGRATAIAFARESPRSGVEPSPEAGILVILSPSRTAKLGRRHDDERSQRLFGMLDLACP